MCEKGFTDPEETDATTVLLDGKFPCNARLAFHIPHAVFDEEPTFGGGGGRHRELKRLLNYE
jgi:hypothetical protein